MTAQAIVRSLRDWVLTLYRSIIDLYRRGVTMLWIAPGVLALVVIPEFIQHVAEIELGMFGTRAQTIAAAEHPTRMALGYLKVVGLVLAIIAAARFWAMRRRRLPWYRMSGMAWGRFVLGFLLFGLVPALPALFAAQIGKTAADAAGIALTLLFLPALFLMLAGLFGDRATPVRAMVRRSWPWAVLTAVLLVLAFAPAQWLHGMNHKWAFGAHPVIVWSLMIFDSILVGLLAGLTGTALYLGYVAFRERTGRFKQ